MTLRRGVLACDCWAGGALVCSLWLPPLAVPVTGSFLLLGPGVALLLMTPVRGVLPKVILCVAFSLAMLTLLSMTAVLFHVWSSSGVVLAESGLVMLMPVVAGSRARLPGPSRRVARWPARRGSDR
jgi:hypothetical protein